jgi:hypothetical protein
MSHNVQKYDRQVYLRVSEAQRCRVHSTLVMPIFALESGDKPVAVFELAQSKQHASFPDVVGWLGEALSQVQLSTTNVDSICTQVGLRKWALDAEMDLSFLDTKQSSSGGAQRLLLQNDAPDEEAGEQHQSRQHLLAAVSAVDAEETAAAAAAAAAAAGNSNGQEVARTPDDVIMSEEGVLGMGSGADDAAAGAACAPASSSSRSLVQTGSGGLTAAAGAAGSNTALHPVKLEQCQGIVLSQGVTGSPTTPSSNGQPQASASGAGAAGESGLHPCGSSSQLGQQQQQQQQALERAASQTTSAGAGEVQKEGSSLELQRPGGWAVIMIERSHTAPCAVSTCWTVPAG